MEAEIVGAVRGQDDPAGGVDGEAGEGGVVAVMRAGPALAAEGRIGRPRVGEPGHHEVGEVARVTDHAAHHQAAGRVDRHDAGPVGAVEVRVVLLAVAGGDPPAAAEGRVEGSGGGQAGQREIGDVVLVGRAADDDEAAGAVDRQPAGVVVAAEVDRRPPAGAEGRVGRSGGGVAGDHEIPIRAEKTADDSDRAVRGDYQVGIMEPEPVGRDDHAGVAEGRVGRAVGVEAGQGEVVIPAVVLDVRPPREQDFAVAENPHLGVPESGPGETGRHPAVAAEGRIERARAEQHAGFELLGRGYRAVRTADAAAWDVAAAKSHADTQRAEPRSQTHGTSSQNEIGLRPAVT